MSSGSINHTAAGLKWISYPVLIIAGILIILFCSSIQHTAAPMKGEYYYSSFLRSNHTWLSNILFFVTGLLAGYLFKLNPWFTGICLFLIFPFTAIAEAAVYKGSLHHNLIPFELVMYFIMALPTVVAVYIGRAVKRKVENRRL